MVNERGQANVRGKKQYSAHSDEDILQSENQVEVSNNSGRLESCQENAENDQTSERKEESEICIESQQVMLTERQMAYLSGNEFDDYEEFDRIKLLLKDDSLGRYVQEQQVSQIRKTDQVETVDEGNELDMSDVDGRFSNLEARLSKMEAEVLGYDSDSASVAGTAFRKKILTKKAKRKIEVLKKDISTEEDNDSSEELELEVEISRKTKAGLRKKKEEFRGGKDKQALMLEIEEYLRSHGKNLNLETKQDLSLEKKQDLNSERKLEQVSSRKQDSIIGNKDLSHKVGENSKFEPEEVMIVEEVKEEENVTLIGEEEVAIWVAVPINDKGKATMLGKEVVMSEEEVTMIFGEKMKQVPITEEKIDEMSEVRDSSLGISKEKASVKQDEISEEDNIKTYESSDKINRESVGWKKNVLQKKHTNADDESSVNDGSENEGSEDESSEDKSSDEISEDMSLGEKSSKDRSSDDRSSEDQAPKKQVLITREKKVKVWYQVREGVVEAWHDSILAKVSENLDHEIEEEIINWLSWQFAVATDQVNNELENMVEHWMGDMFIETSNRLDQSSEEEVEEVVKKKEDVAEELPISWHVEMPIEEQEQEGVDWLADLLIEMSKKDQIVREWLFNEDYMKLKEMHENKNFDFRMGEVIRKKDVQIQVQQVERELIIPNNMKHQKLWKTIDKSSEIAARELVEVEEISEEEEDDDESSEEEYETSMEGYGFLEDKDGVSQLEYEVWEEEKDGISEEYDHSEEGDKSQVDLLLFWNEIQTKYVFPGLKTKIQEDDDSKDEKILRDENESLEEKNGADLKQNKDMNLEEIQMREKDASMDKKDESLVEQHESMGEHGESLAVEATLEEDEVFDEADEILEEDEILEDKYDYTHDDKSLEGKYDSLEEDKENMIREEDEFEVLRKEETEIPEELEAVVQDEQAKNMRSDKKMKGQKKDIKFQKKKAKDPELKKTQEKKVQKKMKPDRKKAVEITKKDEYTFEDEKIPKTEKDVLIGDKENISVEDNVMGKEKTAEVRKVQAVDFHLKLKEVERLIEQKSAIRAEEERRSKNQKTRRKTEVLEEVEEEIDWDELLETVGPIDHLNKSDFDKILKEVGWDELIEEKEKSSEEDVEPDEIITTWRDLLTKKWNEEKEARKKEKEEEAIMKHMREEAEKRIAERLDEFLAELFKQEEEVTKKEEIATERDRQQMREGEIKKRKKKKEWEDLYFHHCTGTSVHLNKFYNVAERMQPERGYDNAIVLSSKPLKMNQFFHVRIVEETACWIGSLYVGVTTLDPATLDFPSSALDLKGTTLVMAGGTIWKDGKPKFTTCNNDLDASGKGDIVSVKHGKGGVVQFYVNGEEQGSKRKLKIQQPVYVLVDLHGRCTKVAIVEPSEKKWKKETVIKRKVNPIVWQKYW